MGFFLLYIYEYAIIMALHPFPSVVDVPENPIKKGIAQFLKATNVRDDFCHKTSKPRELEVFVFCKII